MMDKQIEDAVFQACLEAIEKLGSEIKSMSWFMPIGTLNSAVDTIELDKAA